MSQKIRTVKEYLKEKEKSDKNVMHWKESGLLSGLDEEDARTLAELLETLAMIYMSKVSPGYEDKASSFAFPIARMCFFNLSYLIQNAHKFVNFLDGRVKQEEVNWSQMNVDRMEEMNMEAEFCLTVASEVKSMKI